MRHALVALLLCLPACRSAPSPTSIAEIRAELVSMRDRDQEIRHAMATAGWSELTPQQVHECERIDRENTARLKQIIDRIGWPTISRVGAQASSAAWLLVQHADAEPEFQH